MSLYRKYRFEEEADAKYWLQAVLDQLYSNRPLDLHDLENCLDELCHLFGMQLPMNDLEVERSQRLHPSKVQNVKPLDIREWQQWNNEYLKTINS